MRIKSIHLTNYRCHKDLHVEFRPGFNVLVGVNGSGKTSLLKAISDAFWQPLFRVQGFKQKWDVSGVARLEKVFGGGRLRFEPQLPVIIDTVGVVSNRTYEWKSGPNDSLFVAEGSAFPPFQLETNSIGGQSIRPDDDPNEAAPIFAFYRANRSWIAGQPTAESAAIQRNSRKDAYANWWDASTDSDALQTWVIAKCLQRFQTSNEIGAARERLKKLKEEAPGIAELGGTEALIKRKELLGR